MPISRSSDWLSRLHRQGPSADAVILEAEPGHERRVVEIATVEDDRSAQLPQDALEVRRSELRPVGEDHQRIGLGQCLVAVVEIGDVLVLQGLVRVGHRLGVVAPDLHPPLGEAADGVDRRGLAHVVGAALEGQAPDGQRGCRRPRRRSARSPGRRTGGAVAG